jgi:hypothetical protein
VGSSGITSSNKKVAPPISLSRSIIFEWDRDGSLLALGLVGLLWEVR